MGAPVNPPDLRGIVAPLLSALPPAALSTQPATTILPLLSPILRQRVQLLSSASNEPWIRLLTYDTSKVPKLTEIAQSGSLEPHPVSGEIEVDWDDDALVKYRRLDPETLQCLVVLSQFDLFFRLVYCINDKDGGADGWRVGEVGVASNPSPLASFEGSESVSAAEAAFESGASKSKATNGAEARVDGVNGASQGVGGNHAEDEDDDDDYWARYDATPARTPAQKRSPAPASLKTTKQTGPYRSGSAEDAYYAQYDSVQPAMDNHDPDEEIEHLEPPPPPLGLRRPSNPLELDNAELNETSGAWTLADPPRSPSKEEEERMANLQHPRPESPASSNGSLTVAKLEETAEKRDQTEFGVKQHISRSIRSLFLLSRASGIDREEFERMVRTELDVLAMVEEDV